MAARAVHVPEQELLGWMHRAERMFKGDRNNVFRFFTHRDVFLDFLKTARAEMMPYMPDPAGDRELVEIMMRDEVLLLGGSATLTSTQDMDRPNVVLVELIRWLLEDRARPLCFLP